MDIKERFRSDSLFKIMHASLFAYLVLLPFPHVTTIKEITFWLAVLFWLMLMPSRSQRLLPVNPVTISLALFMAIALIASITGVEPVENLKRFKGELLVPFLLFSISATEYNSMTKIRRLLTPLVIAFAVYTIFVIAESFSWGLSYFWDQTLRQQVKWLSGYAEMSITLLPLTFGYLLLTGTRLRFFILIFLSLEFFIAAAYRNISAFGGSVFVLLMGAIFVRPGIYRFCVRVFIVIVILISSVMLYTHRDNPAIAEYRLKLYQITHPYEELKKSGGFTNRVPLWKAAIDVIKDRPVLGYGWGMKKYARIISDDKYLSRWKTDEPKVYEIYSEYRGKYVPPHNLVLELTFQSGIIGLISFTVFFAVYLFYIIKTAIISRSDEDRNFSVMIVLGIIFSFMIANIMSNELGRLSGKVLFVVMGAGAAWLQSKKSEHPVSVE
ncbi:MAG TPA: O-antigen ligase family protein [Nitrospirae bacterium]|nr:O-antigen ligase family protein [Nitrospirota bacterium]